MDSKKVLGIIAGSGQFPFLVAQGAQKCGYRVVAICFSGNSDPKFPESIHAALWLKIGQLGKLIDFFKKQGVGEIVFAGAIDKPRALDLRPDFRILKLALRLSSRNDNALLQAVADELRAEGFVVASPLSFVSDLPMPMGAISQRKPSQEESADIVFGWPIAKELGRLDIGQCTVVKGGMVVAVEAMEGTNATIARAASLVGKGGTVIKIFKPGQEEHIDQPAVGLGTIEAMAKASLTCLAVEADRALFFDRTESLEMADRHGIAVVGVRDGVWS